MRRLYRRPDVVTGRLQRRSAPISLSPLARFSFQVRRAFGTGRPGRRAWIDMRSGCHVDFAAAPERAKLGQGGADGFDGGLGDRDDPVRLWFLR